MSELLDIKRHLERNQQLKNSGASNDDIQTAALTLIAEQICEIGADIHCIMDDIGTIAGSDFEDLSGTDKPSLSKAEGDDADD